MELIGNVTTTLWFSLLILIAIKTMLKYRKEAKNKANERNNKASSRDDSK